MKIIISWSGERSKLIASAFHWWLPLCLQSTEPWMSDQDLPKGKRWLIEVTKQLSGSSLGIICLTPENLDSPWIHFEAGALSKSEGAYLWTYLHDLKPTDVKGPLEDFQHTWFLEDEIKKLVGTINSASETKLEEHRFNETFETYWPKLKERLEQIPKNPSSPPIKRRVDDMVLEILERVRDLSNSLALPTRDPLVEAFWRHALFAQNALLPGEGKSSVTIGQLMKEMVKRTKEESRVSSPTASPSPEPFDKPDD